MKLTKFHAKWFFLTALIAAFVWSTLRFPDTDLTTEKKPGKAVTSFSMMSFYNDAAPPPEPMAFFEEVQQRTGTDIRMIWVPKAAYTDRVNLALSSGEMPDVLFVKDNKPSPIVEAVRKGLFWEIGPYLSRFPNLRQLNPKTLENLSIDGKIYGIPRSRLLARDAITYRKDWLDSLGLQEPQTIDELYRMLKAFTYDDPDGNGKQDTWGLLSAKDGYMYFRTVVGWFGGPNRWQVQEGQFTADHETKAYLQALKFMRRLYSEGILNPDFAVFSETKKALQEGTGGANIANIENAYNYTFSLEKDSKAVFDILQLIEGPQGIRIPALPGYGGTYLFPKSEVKTESELLKLLQFFDTFMSESMIKLLDFGIEGKHHTVLEGVPTLNRDIPESIASELQIIKELRIDPRSTLPKGREPLALKINRFYDDHAQNTVENPADPLLSETMILRGAELDQIVEDAYVNFIMGRIDEAGWRAEIEKWRKQGGNAVKNELSAAYGKLQSPK
ncbi:hypothetical protein SY83_03295 [Paenibacillus swuensis]|uniref:ABC transporter substrate-binding protein n=1 Tax=Paenibacillus swuensis TaxID=1178515 RepID=A0A172TF26_9BACL|nr:extracellular solute-binding protein [Paenibacillus swuensis]ANE45504.1 hypothetical protein SY83_03295 [Paenibacillus swuensis]